MSILWPLAIVAVLLGWLVVYALCKVSANCDDEEGTR